MRRVLFTIEYDGTAYVGWQRQKNGVSIQEKIESALIVMDGRKVTLHASGRTDAGVHAVAQTAHADIKRDIPDEGLMRGLNAMLPKDIAIISAKTVPGDFHARFWVKSKTYRYDILNRPAPSALLRSRAWHIPRKLDLSKMRRAAKLFIGKHDFASFKSAGSETETSVRTITRLDIRRDGDMVSLYFAADGFLKQMVRNITGQLADAGLGKIELERVRAVIESKDRRAAGITAPPQGLYLVKVDY